MKNLLLSLSRKMRLSRKTVPDVQGNERARKTIAHTTTKGLWMSLGREVKVINCMVTEQVTKNALSLSKTTKLGQFRVAHKDPMYDILQENKRHEKDVR